MKLLKKLAALCMSAVLGTCGIMGGYSSASAVSAAETKASVPEGFVYAEGTHFMCDGEPFYFAGCNSYDMFTLGDGSSASSISDIETKYMYKDQIDTRMQEMQDNGVTVLRTWGFSNETWHGFELSPGEYNEAEFMLFDYIMYSAQQHNIRVIITLENYWEAYGGIDKKLSWAGLTGGSHTNRAQYFTNEICKQWYKDYAKHFAERTNYFTGVQYKDDPTIFAWDLMNEPRYQDAGEDSTGLTLRAWVDEMGAYIKSVDPNHMVYAGLEGHGLKYGFGGDEGNPFVYIQESPYIDFCSAHPYPDEHWANMTPEDTKTTMLQWISDSHEVVGKPFAVTEFNVHSSLSDEEYKAYWRAVFDTIEEQDAGGGLFWEFNDRKLSEFTVMNGDPILTYFKEHSEKMQNQSPKNGLSGKNLRINVDAPEDLTLSYQMMVGEASGLQLDDADLTAGTDYEMADGTITLKKHIFESASIGTHIVRLLTTDGNQPMVKVQVYSKASEEAARSIIDDYESYDNDDAIAMAYKRNSNGDSLTLTLDTEHVKNGKAALKYDYSVADGGPGYCGATKTLGGADWTGFDGIRFWILSDGSNRETTFQFVDGAGAYWESIQKVTAEEGWTEVKIPFSDFHVQQWGTAASEPTLSGVVEFSIYTGQNGNPGTGVWYFDDIGLYSDSTPIVTTESTETTVTETTTTTTMETTTESSSESSSAETSASTDTTVSSSETTTETSSETTVSDTETTITVSTTATETESTASSSVDPAQVLYGDVNLDGRVDITDAVLLNKATAGAVKLGDSAAKNADCDGDDVLSTNDAVTLLKFLVHLVSTLPSEA
ncbi:carbohydrate binding domain-containing protein [uncultured Ruminococcus sp.]|uniref:carbohydrate binding domain-containing protein n=1 Tax=uncultured Ruminococcus sp. TaxID=165186 RepID=UPI00260694DE|nr:carbohydrate binding domain-containing protein [uncultured Ruminococcus sp.]